MMKFRYKRIAVGLIRPIIPIEIKYSGRTIRYEALIDSGADLCIFDAQLSEILGIKTKKGVKKMIGGITGVKQPYYIHPVTISIGGWDYDIQAGFMPDMPGFGYGVLGQMGFFENFGVKFDYSKAEIELSPKIRN